MNKIEEFIKRRFPNDCNWLNGNCYYFAIILKTRFPEGTIVYDIIDGHFMLKIGRHLYDYAGKHNVGNRTLIEWDKFDEYDTTIKANIVRNVIK